MTITDNGTIASTTEGTETAPARPASTLRRRGLVAGAAALAAALLARQSNDPVRAADGLSLLIGRNNLSNDTNNIYATTTSMTNGTAPTPLTGTVPTNAGAPTAGFRVFNSYPYGTNGTVIDATADAIQGFAATANNSGVHGRNDTLNAIGTTGVASNGTGIYGQSTSGTAVGASTTSGNAIVAVTTGGYGAVVSTTNGVGVYATSTNLTGVYGQTSGGGQYGVIGVGAAPGTFGLAGIANQNGSAAFAGGTSNATCYAASFAGHVLLAGLVEVQNAAPNQPMVVSGHLIVNGNTIASLSHTDGTTRQSYAMSSPEPWVEDFGRGQVTNGQAQVTFDADFTGVTNTDNYDVFLTEYDGNHGLYVTGKTAKGFAVKAASGSPNASFAWRAVVKARATGAKTAAKAERLAKVSIPNSKPLDIAKLEASLPKAPPAHLPARKP